MSNNRKILFIGIFWAVIIAGFIGSKEFTLQTGREVFFKIEPVDPRDLFRGDYVVLDYEISTIDPTYLEGDYYEFEPGETVYVELDPRSKCASPVGIYKSQPMSEFFIKGRVQDVWDEETVIVEYGIENYFVPEGKGREIENLSGDDLVVKASIDRFGNAVIKDLSVNGNECRVEPPNLMLR